MGAISVYMSRVISSSAAAKGDSLWNTWIELHHKWFGAGPGSLPVLPLTPESIQAVTAMLIHGGYRTIANFLSKAKDEHVGARHEWHPWLAREHKRAGSAGTRGIGPSHQCHEMDVVLLHITDFAFGGLAWYSYRSQELRHCGMFLCATRGGSFLDAGELSTCRLQQPKGNNSVAGFKNRSQSVVMLSHMGMCMQGQ